MNRAVFLDRDGTIIREVDYLRSEDELDILPGSAEALRVLKDAGYICIVITNQSVVARGLSDIETVERVHAGLKVLLEEAGGSLDAIYYCPHYPDKNAPGANPEYSIECECRKPKTGMIGAAVKRFNIDLSASYIIGDSTQDVETGRRAGMTTILVKTGYGGSDKRYNVVPDFTFADLLGAARFIVDRTGRKMR